MAKRFDIMITPVETGEEETKNWITESQLLTEVRKMDVNDEMIIHRVENSTPGDVGRPSTL